MSVIIHCERPYADCRFVETMDFGWFQVTWNENEQTSMRQEWEWATRDTVQLQLIRRKFAMRTLDVRVCVCSLCTK